MKSRSLISKKYLNQRRKNERKTFFRILLPLFFSPRPTSTDTTLFVTPLSLFLLLTRYFPSWELEWHPLHSTDVKAQKSIKHQWLKYSSVEAGRWAGGRKKTTREYDIIQNCLSPGLGLVFSCVFPFFLSFKHILVEYSFPWEFKWTGAVLGMLYAVHDECRWE